MVGRVWGRNAQLGGGAPVLGGGAPVLGEAEVEQRLWTNIIWLSRKIFPTTLIPVLHIGTNDIFQGDSLLVQCVCRLEKNLRVIILWYDSLLYSPQGL